jgi:cobalamin biosynthesis protein CobT
MVEEERDPRQREQTDQSDSEDGARGDEGRRDEERERQGGRGQGAEDISDTTAPSIGPHSVVEREPVEERLARHEQSPVDAMGEDKRRQVVGKTYGPTFARQAVLYGIFLVVVAAIAFGIKVAVDHFDQPPKHFAAEAPWAQNGVKQIKPKPLQ